METIRDNIFYFGAAFNIVMTLLMYLNFKYSKYGRELRLQISNVVIIAVSLILFTMIQDSRQYMTIFSLTACIATLLIAIAVYVHIFRIIVRESKQAKKEMEYE